MGFSTTPDHDPQAARPKDGPRPSSRPAFQRPSQERKPKFEQSFIDDVLSRTDIVDVIGEVVALRPRGSSGEMIGKCPFHNDSHPSFEVNGTKGIYSCWSCSAGMNGKQGGDAIAFIQRFYDKNFVEAVEHLAFRAGIPIPGDKLGTSYTPPRPAPRASTPRPPPERAPGEPDLGADRGLLLSALAKAQRLYAQELPASPNALEYLASRRGIRPEVLHSYGVGYAPPGFNFLRKHNDDYAATRTFVDAGLAKDSDKGSRYDLFRDRLMFPIRNEQGQVIAFGGRRLSDQQTTNAHGQAIRAPKYLNSPETAVFSKRQTIYGWFESASAIKDAGFVITVEGYMDVLGLANHRIQNAIATMGTALTEEHVDKILERTHQIVMCMDGDKAGQEGAFRSLSSLFPRLTEDVKVTFLILPEEQDPDEYVKTHGRESFLAQLKNGLTLPEFFEKALKTIYALDDSRQREQMKSTARLLIARLPADSPFQEKLSLIVERLAAGERQQQSRPQGRPSSSGFQTATSNAPSASAPTDRLLLAVMRLPKYAGALRPELVRMQQSVDPDLLPAVAQWQVRFDQALAAGGTAQTVPLSDQEQRLHRAIIDAAPSILSQHLQHLARQRLDDQRARGLINESTYLARLGRSHLAKPR
ncbi:DNA primase [Stenotrophomonas geniculata]|jgi:DNA primase|uniref:DNA primase n=1 Tax=Stenotrophomonas geniculata TaxID=86188 RepID=UPI003D3400E9